ncbi:MAG: hypothetical protein IJM51_06275 [Clostridia bacterium]|nr:hypothetical protein [Clostridia bacterium]
MKKIFSLVTVSLVAMAMVFTVPFKAFAASTDQANGAFDSTKTNKLTVVYNAEDTTFEDTAIQLYRVADLTSDYDFVLTDEFASCGLDLSNLDSSDQWEVVADTLDAFVKANSPAAAGEFTLGANHCKAEFSGLTPGWYFIPQVVLVCENDDRTFSSVIATLPTVEEGEWVYSVETNPKSEIIVPTYKDVTYFINVVWDDKGYENYRPDSVVAHVSHTGGPTGDEVKVIKTSVSSVAEGTPRALTFGMAALNSAVRLLSGTEEAPAEEIPATAPAEEVPSDVTISSDMNWHYEWTTKDDGTVWNVIGSDVDHYTLTVQTVDHGWILEYHIVPPPSPVPKTGEEFPWIPVVLLSVSGAMLVVLGVVSRRRAHD